MITHYVKVSPSKSLLSKTEQLAWKIAAVATNKAAIDSAAGEMVINRIIDNASVALAAINRTPVANARTQTLAHPRVKGAMIFGLSSAQRFDCEWEGRRWPHLSRADVRAPACGHWRQACD